MEILALLIWLVLAAVAPALLPAIAVAPGAGLSLLAALTGVAVAVLCLFLGAPVWAAWTQVGLALLGFVGGTLGAAQLNDGQFTSGSAGQELAGGVLGLQLPFYATVTFVTLLLALQVTDPVV